MKFNAQSGADRLRSPIEGPPDFFGRAAALDYCGRLEWVVHHVRDGFRFVFKKTSCASIQLPCTVRHSFHQIGQSSMEPTACPSLSMLPLMRLLPTKTLSVCRTKLLRQRCSDIGFNRSTCLLTPHNMHAIQHICRRGHCERNRF